MFFNDGSLLPQHFTCRTMQQMLQSLVSYTVQTGWWGGNTLLIDFPFPAFPESMGHWAEVLLPVYSALVTGAWKQHVQGPSRHIDRLLLSNVRRDQLQVHIQLFLQFVQKNSKVFSMHHSVCLQRVAMLVVTADVCLLDCCTWCLEAGNPAVCHFSFWRIHFMLHCMDINFIALNTTECH